MPRHSTSGRACHRTIDWTALSRLPLHRSPKEPSPPLDLLAESLAILAELLTLSSKAFTPGAMPESAQRRRLQQLDGRLSHLEACLAQQEEISGACSDARPDSKASQ